MSLRESNVFKQKYNQKREIQGAKIKIKNHENFEK